MGLGDRSNVWSFVEVNIVAIRKADADNVVGQEDVVRRAVLVVELAFENVLVNRKDEDPLWELDILYGGEKSGVTGGDGFLARKPRYSGIEQIFCGQERLLKLAVQPQLFVAEVKTRERKLVLFPVSGLLLEDEIQAVVKHKPHAEIVDQGGKRQRQRFALQVVCPLKKREEIQRDPVKNDESVGSQKNLFGILVPLRVDAKSPASLLAWNSVSRVTAVHAELLFLVRVHVVVLERVNVGGHALAFFRGPDEGGPVVNFFASNHHFPPVGSDNHVEGVVSVDPDPRGGRLGRNFGVVCRSSRSKLPLNFKVRVFSHAPQIVLISQYKVDNAGLLLNSRARFEHVQGVA